VTTISAANAFTNVKNVENVAITGTGAVSLTAPLAASLTFDLSSTDAQDLTFSTGYTGDTVVNLAKGSAVTGEGDKVVNNANVKLTVNANSDNLDADGATTTITGGTGTDILNITLGANTGTISLAQVTKFETVNILANSTTATQGATITGLANGVAGSTVTVDASALTNSSAALSFTSGTNTQKMVITGGAGGDTIVLNGSGANTVDGGAGNDTIRAGTNGAQLTGGAGDDLFILTASSATTGNKEIGTFSSITDFGVGNDVLELTFFNGSGSAVSGVADGAAGAVLSFAKLTAVIDAELGLNNYINAAINQATLGQAVWFNYNGNAYVVVDSGTEGTSFQNEQDLVIRLTGVNGDNLSYNQTEGTIALI